MVIDIPKIDIEAKKQDEAKLPGLFITEKKQYCFF